MRAPNIKSYIAVVAAAVGVGFAAIAPAATAAGFAAAPALTTGSGGGAGNASMPVFHLTQMTPAMSNDPQTFFDGAQSAVLCATAIEYGLIAA
jgi:hypothetical protein